MRQSVRVFSGTLAHYVTDYSFLDWRQGYEKPYITIINRVINPDTLLLFLYEIPLLI